MRTHVSAKVKIELEIPVDGSWGGDCKMEQVREQATTEALSMVTSRYTADYHINRWRLTAKPQVSAVIVTDSNEEKADPLPSFEQKITERFMELGMGQDFANQAAKEALKIVLHSEW